MTHTPRPRPLAVAAALFLGVAVAGCIGDPGEPDDAPLVFSDSRGPGGMDPLIPLTDDPAGDAAAILDACGAVADREGCVVDHLKAVLGAAGSVYAFDVLDEMSGQDADIERRNHPLAHLLGHHALYVYGTIGNTLAHCSHKVFQGCIHGALEEYFRHVDELNAGAVLQACPTDGTQFEQYACLHGLGHGLVLATDYDLQDALDLCAHLQTSHGRSSCYGGAFMENVVAYLDHQRWLQAGGGQAVDDDDPHAGHFGDGGIVFWIDEDDPKYPCNAVREKYERHCWGMQTSLVLHFNRGDFEATARVCDELGENVKDRCYRSLGRDISSRTKRDPAQGSANCAFASDDEMRGHCVAGWIGTVVTRFADPAVGLQFCPGFQEQDKPMCYERMAVTGRSMIEADELASLCDQVEEPFRTDCRRGARLD